MGNKTPVILSADAETKEVFRGMIADTTDAIIRSYDDNTAYSGKDVYKLREDLDRLGFLPEKAQVSTRPSQQWKRKSCPTC